MADRRRMGSGPASDAVYDGGSSSRRYNENIPLRREKGAEYESATEQTRMRAAPPTGNPTYPPSSYPADKQRGEEAILSSSAEESSSSSSYIDISRNFPFNKFKLTSFFTTPSESRRRRKSKSKKRRSGLFKHGGRESSSSESLDGDLAYGTGFIKKIKRGVRSRKGKEIYRDGVGRGSRTSLDGRSRTSLDGGRRAEKEEGRTTKGRGDRDPTNAELLALGAGLRKLAKESNDRDLRHAARNLKGSEVHTSGFGASQSRGLGPSRIEHHEDQDDEDGWESASDDGSESSSVDSGLAFGQESVGGWSFFGGRKKHKPLSKKNTIVDPRLFGPANSLNGVLTQPVGFGEVSPWNSNSDFGQAQTPYIHGPGGETTYINQQQQNIGPSYYPPPPQVDHRSSYSGSQVSLQQVYPVATDDPYGYDAARSSVVSGAPSYTSRRPDPVPIQQPQPITPVSQSMYNEPIYSGRSRSDSGNILKKTSASSGRGKSIAEIALAGAAVAAGGAAIAASRDRDRDDRKDRERERDRERRREEDERERERDLKRRREEEELAELERERLRRRDSERKEPKEDCKRDKRGDSERKDSKSDKKSKRGSPDRDDRKENRRDSERESKKSSGSSSKRKEEPRDEKEERREKRREERRAAERSDSGRGKAETVVVNPTSVDPFQYQIREEYVAPDVSSPSAQPQIQSHSRHESVPTVVTVEREPDFARMRSSSIKEPYVSRSEPRKDYSDRDERERQHRSSSRGQTFEDARHIYEETEHSTAPIAAAAIGAAVAAVAVEGYRESRSDKRREERRSERRDDYDDRDYKSRDKKPSAPERDPIQEEADRAYREIVMARKIASQVIRSRSPSPNRSVVDKYEDKDEEEEPVRIVTPPGMEDPKKIGPYDAPNADFRPDYVLEDPRDLRTFQIPIISRNRAHSLPAHDPEFERPRPLLNLVRPTPVPSPVPEKQEKRKDRERSRSGSKSRERSRSRDRKREEPKRSDTDDVVIGPKGTVVNVITVSPSPTASTVSKAVTWGENETKHFEVESPGEHRDEFVSTEEVRAREVPIANESKKVKERQVREEPVEVKKVKETGNGNGKKGMGWGAIAAGIIGVGAGAAAASTTSSETTPKSPKSKKEERSAEPTPKSPKSKKEETPKSPRVKTEDQPASSYEYRGVVVEPEPESPRRIQSQQTPPSPKGPKPSSQIPGAFGDDLDFTATVAAGLQDTGFDPNIVIDDPSFHRRASPPGSNGPSPIYRAPFAETVSDFGTIPPSEPSSSRFPQGSILGEVYNTPRDWRSVSPPRENIVEEEPSVKLSKKEQKKRDKLKRQSSEASTPGEEFSTPRENQSPEEPQEAYFDAPKLSKKEQKKRDKAAAAAAAAVAATAAFAISSSSKKHDSPVEQSTETSSATPTPMEHVVSDEIVAEPDSYFETPKKSSKKSKRDSERHNSPSRSIESPSRGIESPSSRSFPVETPSSSSQKSKRDSERYDSPSKSVAPFETDSEVERSLNMKSKDRSSRRSEQEEVDPADISLPPSTPSETPRKSKSSRRSEYDDVHPEDVSLPPSTPSDTPRKSKKSSRQSEYDDVHPEDVSLPPSTPSEISRDGDYEDSRRSRKSSAKDNGTVSSADRGTSRSVVSAGTPRYDDDEHRRKKKHRSSTRDDDDTRSVASEPAGFDDSKKKKEKKGSGFFGLFGSKSEVGARDARDESPKGSKDDFDEVKKKKKSKRHSTSDAASLYGDFGSQSVGDLSRSVSNGHSNGNGDYDDDEKKKNRSQSQSTSSKKDSFLDNAGTLGAGVGIASVAAAIVATHHHSQSSKADHTAIDAEEENSAESLARDEREPSIDPEILDEKRDFRPSIDPQYGDLLPLPPSEPVSPNLESLENLPELPESRPNTPPETPTPRITRDRSTTIGRRNLQELPTKSPSQSAVPLKFLLGNRSQPSSPGFARASPVQSPSAVRPDSPVFQRTRQARPTSWDSTKEYKPLFLVENNRRGSSAQGRELGRGLEGPLLSQVLGRSTSPEKTEEKENPLAIDTVLASKSRPDLLGSGQSTPRAGVYADSPEYSSQSKPFEESSLPQSSLAAQPKEPETEPKGLGISAAIAAVGLASTIGYFASAPSQPKVKESWMDELPSVPTKRKPSPLSTHEPSPALSPKQPSSPVEDLPPLNRSPSPIDVVTADGSSYLFNSSPSRKSDESGSQSRVESPSNVRTVPLDVQLARERALSALSGTEPETSFVDEKVEEEISSTTEHDDPLPKQGKKGKKSKNKNKRQSLFSAPDESSIAPESSKDVIEEVSTPGFPKVEEPMRESPQPSKDIVEEGPALATEDDATPVAEPAEDPFFGMSKKDRKKAKKGKGLSKVETQDDLSALPSTSQEKEQIPALASESSRELPQSSELVDINLAEETTTPLESNAADDYFTPSTSKKDKKKAKKGKGLSRSSTQDDISIAPESSQDTISEPSTSVPTEPVEEPTVSKSKKDKKKGKKNKSISSSFGPEDFEEQSAQQVSESREITEPSTPAEEFFTPSRSGAISRADSVVVLPSVAEPVETSREIVEEPTPSAPVVGEPGPSKSKKDKKKDRKKSKSVSSWDPAPEVENPQQFQLPQLIPVPAPVFRPGSLATQESTISSSKSEEDAKKDEEQSKSISFSEPWTELESRQQFHSPQLIPVPEPVFKPVSRGPAETTTSASNSHDNIKEEQVTSPEPEYENPQSLHSPQLMPVPESPSKPVLVVSEEVRAPAQLEKLNETPAYNSREVNKDENQSISTSSREAEAKPDLPSNVSQPPASALPTLSGDGVGTEEVPIIGGEQMLQQHDLSFSEPEEKFPSHPLQLGKNVNAVVEPEADEFFDSQSIPEETGTTQDLGRPGHSHQQSTDSVEIWHEAEMSTEFDETPTTFTKNLDHAKGLEGSKELVSTPLIGEDEKKSQHQQEILRTDEDLTAESKDQEVNIGSSKSGEVTTETNTTTQIPSSESEIMGSVSPIIPVEDDFVFPEIKKGKKKSKKGKNALKDEPEPEVESIVDASTTEKNVDLEPESKGEHPASEETPPVPEESEFVDSKKSKKQKKKKGKSISAWEPEESEPTTPVPEAAPEQLPETPSEEVPVEVVAVPEEIEFVEGKKGKKKGKKGKAKEVDSWEPEVELAASQESTSKELPESPEMETPSQEKPAEVIMPEDTEFVETKKKGKKSKKGKSVSVSEPEITTPLPEPSPEELPTPSEEKSREETILEKSESTPSQAPEIPIEATIPEENDFVESKKSKKSKKKGKSISTPTPEPETERSLPSPSPEGLSTHTQEASAIDSVAEQPSTISSQDSPVKTLPEQSSAPPTHETPLDASIPEETEFLESKKSKKSKKAKSASTPEPQTEKSLPEPSPEDLSTPSQETLVIKTLPEQSSSTPSQETPVEAASPEEDYFGLVENKKGKKKGKKSKSISTPEPELLTPLPEATPDVFMTPGQGPEPEESTSTPSQETPAEKSIPDESDFVETKKGKKGKKGKSTSTPEPELQASLPEEPETSSLPSQENELQESTSAPSEEIPAVETVIPEEVEFVESKKGKKGKKKGKSISSLVPEVETSAPSTPQETEDSKELETPSLKKSKKKSKKSQSLIDDVNFLDVQQEPVEASRSLDEPVEPAVEAKSEEKPTEDVSEQFSTPSSKKSKKKGKKGQNLEAESEVQPPAETTEKTLPIEAGDNTPTPEFDDGFSTPTSKKGKKKGKKSKAFDLGEEQSSEKEIEESPAATPLSDSDAFATAQQTPVAPQEKSYFPSMGSLLPFAAAGAALFGLKTSQKETPPKEEVAPKSAEIETPIPPADSESKPAPDGFAAGYKEEQLSLARQMQEEFAKKSKGKKKRQSLPATPERETSRSRVVEDPQEDSSRARSLSIGPSADRSAVSPGTGERKSVYSEEQLELARQLKAEFSSPTPKKSKKDKKSRFSRSATRDDLDEPEESQQIEVPPTAPVENIESMEAPVTPTGDGLTAGYKEEQLSLARQLQAEFGKKSKKGKKSRSTSRTPLDDEPRDDYFGEASQSLTAGPTHPEEPQPSSLQTPDNQPVRDGLAVGYNEEQLALARQMREEFEAKKAKKDEKKGKKSGSQVRDNTEDDFGTDALNKDVDQDNFSTPMSEFPGEGPSTPIAADPEDEFAIVGKKAKKDKKGKKRESIARGRTDEQFPSETVSRDVSEPAPTDEVKGSVSEPVAVEPEDEFATVTKKSKKDKKGKKKGSVVVVAEPEEENSPATESKDLEFIQDVVIVPEEKSISEPLPEVQDENPASSKKSKKDKKNKKRGSLVATEPEEASSSITDTKDEEPNQDVPKTEEKSVPELGTADPEDEFATAGKKAKKDKKGKKRASAIETPVASEPALEVISKEDEQTQQIPTPEETPLPEPAAADPEDEFASVTTKKSKKDKKGKKRASLIPEDEIKLEPAVEESKEIEEPETVLETSKPEPASIYPEDPQDGLDSVTKTSKKDRKGKTRGGASQLESRELSPSSKEAPIEAINTSLPESSAPRDLDRQLDDVPPEAAEIALPESPAPENQGNELPEIPREAIETFSPESPAPKSEDKQLEDISPAPIETSLPESPAEEPEDYFSTPTKKSKKDKKGKKRANTLPDFDEEAISPGTIPTEAPQFNLPETPPADVEDEFPSSKKSKKDKKGKKRSNTIEDSSASKAIPSEPEGIPREALERALPESPSAEFEEDFNPAKKGKKDRKGKKRETIQEESSTTDSTSESNPTDTETTSRDLPVINTEVQVDEPEDFAPVTKQSKPDKKAKKRGSLLRNEIFSASASEDLGTEVESLPETREVEGESSKAPFEDDFDFSAKTPGHEEQMREAEISREVPTDVESIIPEKIALPESPAPEVVSELVDDFEISSKESKKNKKRQNLSRSLASEDIHEPHQDDEKKIVEESRALDFEHENLPALAPSPVEEIRTEKEPEFETTLPSVATLPLTENKDIDATPEPSAAILPSTETKEVDVTPEPGDEWAIPSTKKSKKDKKKRKDSLFTDGGPSGQSTPVSEEHAVVEEKSIVKPPAILEPVSEKTILPEQPLNRDLEVASVAIPEEPPITEAKDEWDAIPIKKSKKGKKNRKEVSNFDDVEASGTSAPFEAIVLPKSDPVSVPLPVEDVQEKNVLAAEPLIQESKSIEDVIPEQSFEEPEEEPTYSLKKSKKDKKKQKSSSKSEFAEISGTSTPVEPISEPVDEWALPSKKSKKDKKKQKSGTSTPAEFTSIAEPESSQPLPTDEAYTDKSIVQEPEMTLPASEEAVDEWAMPSKKSKKDKKKQKPGISTPLEEPSILEPESSQAPLETETFADKSFDPEPETVVPRTEEVFDEWDTSSSKKSKKDKKKKQKSGVSTPIEEPSTLEPESSQELEIVEPPSRHPGTETAEHTSSAAIALPLALGVISRIPGLVEQPSAPEPETSREIVNEAEPEEFPAWEPTKKSKKDKKKNRKSGTSTPAEEPTISGSEPVVEAEQSSQSEHAIPKEIVPAPWSHEPETTQATFTERDLPGDRMDIDPTQVSTRDIKPEPQELTDDAFAFVTKKSKKDKKGKRGSRSDSLSGPSTLSTATEAIAAPTAERLTSSPTPFDQDSHMHDERPLTPVQEPVHNESREIEQESPVSMSRKSSKNDKRKRQATVDPSTSGDLAAPQPPVTSWAEDVEEAEVERSPPVIEEIAKDESLAHVPSTTEAAPFDDFTRPTKKSKKGKKRNSSISSTAIPELSPIKDDAQPESSSSGLAAIGVAGAALAGAALLSKSESGPSTPVKKLSKKQQRKLSIDKRSPTNDIFDDPSLWEEAEPRAYVGESRDVEDAGDDGFWSPPKEVREVVDEERDAREVADEESARREGVPEVRVEDRGVERGVEHGVERRYERERREEQPRPLSMITDVSSRPTTRHSDADFPPGSPTLVGENQTSGDSEDDGEKIVEQESIMRTPPRKDIGRFDRDQGGQTVYEVRTDDGYFNQPRSQTSTFEPPNLFQTPPTNKDLSFEQPSPIGQEHISEPPQEISPRKERGVAFQEVPIERTIPPYYSGSKFAHSGFSDLPIVDEESPAQLEAERLFSPHPQDADFNRDSAFVTDSPTPPQRGFADDHEYVRDSGVHLRDFSPAPKAHAPVSSADDAIARLSWPAVHEDTETVDLHKSQRPPVQTPPKVPKHRHQEERNSPESHDSSKSKGEKASGASYSQRSSGGRKSTSPPESHRPRGETATDFYRSQRVVAEAKPTRVHEESTSRDLLRSQASPSPKPTGLHRTSTIHGHGAHGLRRSRGDSIGSLPQEIKEEKQEEPQPAPTLRGRNSQGDNLIRQRLPRFETPEVPTPTKPKEDRYSELNSSPRPLAQKPKGFSDLQPGAVIAGAALGFAAARKLSLETRPETPPTLRQSSNPSRLRTPEISRPESVTSNLSNRSNRSSGTPPLRRSDRKYSGDLRSLSQRSKPDLAKEAELAAIATATSANTVNTANPTANEGRVRAKDMADVYDGFGEGRMGSPRSPTRPHSMRRRQSMQVLDLEAKVEQLAAENRMLAEYRAQAERHLHSGNQASSSLAEKNEEIDALKRTLEYLQNEVTRLTEVNDGLSSANATIARQHTDRYNMLETQHAQATRELAEVRMEHGNLSSGMEGIVRNEVLNAVAEKDREIAQLRADLETAKEKIRQMQRQILAAKGSEIDFLTIRDEDHFDNACQQLCQHVQQWVLRFSKFSDMRACRLTSEINNDKTIDRLDNAILDGSDVDNYLADRIKRRDVFMSMTMTMVWEFVFTRYLFGMDREQRQKLKSLEKTLTEVGPAAAVHQWRATTLTLLSKRSAFAQQREQDTKAVVHAILETLSEILPPPSHLEQQIEDQLTRVMKSAVDLSIEMRTQRAEYMMLPPLQPEYDANGDLASKVTFNAALMNERSGDTVSNEELEAQKAVVRIVLFPLVVKKGDDRGEGDEEIVVCPAQVLVAKPKKQVRVFSPSSMMGKKSENNSRTSMQSSMPDNVV